MRSTSTSLKKLRVILGALLALVCGLVALSASAELALLTNGDFLKVESYELIGDDKLRLDLDSGGSLFLPVGRVERIVDDEIVYAEPSPVIPEIVEKARLVELRWTSDAALPAVPYGELFFDAGKRFSLNPTLLAAMARAESAFDASAISSAGARGLLQLMPATAERFGVRRSELYVPVRNIEAASRYLNFLIKEFDGELELVLAAYNAGEGNVRKYSGVPPFSETKNYIKRIYRFLGLDG